MLAREAFFARARMVPLDHAIDQVAAELVIPYPPDIPAVIPGELVAAETVAYLQDGVRHGMHVRRPADLSLEAIRVVTEEATLFRRA